jgi:hypothetical protein
MLRASYLREKGIPNAIIGGVGDNGFKRNFWPVFSEFVITVIVA